MRGLAPRIMEHAESHPEASPLVSSDMLSLGSRSAVNRALSHLAQSGALLRISRGVYMRPIMTEFGPCAPSLGMALAALSELWGETIVPSGGAAANCLRLTP